ncbi:MAG: hypothetical protein IIV21_03980, partial [Bacteroidales bacterium]|nr:hypothetical protein [Bacteroidales bacterium]
MTRELLPSHYKSLLTILIVFFVLFLSSCSEKEDTFIEPEVVKALPIINVDSIFINLDEEIIKKKAASIDKVFSNLRRKVGFNGTVL